MEYPDHAHALEVSGALDPSNVHDTPPEVLEDALDPVLGLGIAATENMSGGPPVKEGRKKWALPTVLKAFTTWAPGRSRWTCSPAESVWPTASLGAPPEKSRGLVASMRTFSSNLCSSPAERANP